MSPSTLPLLEFTSSGNNRFISAIGSFEVKLRLVETRLLHELCDGDVIQGQEIHKYIPINIYPETVRIPSVGHFVLFLQKYLLKLLRFCVEIRYTHFSCNGLPV